MPAWLDGVVGWLVRWSDRDRIVLLYEYIASNYCQPDGSYEWESRVLYRAGDLWSEGREGSNWFNDERHAGGMNWADFAHDEAPGWRMLSSLPSCPNPHMRFRMSRAMLERVQNHGAELGASGRNAHDGNL